jgi:archaetidylinositol phosphate synthase
MVLNSYRGNAEPYLLPLAKRLRNVEPNTLTWIAFVFAVFAGISFYMNDIWLLLVADLCIFLNALFDALDGKVAKITGKASRRGDFLDHVLDRYADVFIIGGIMLSIHCNWIIGLLALLGVIFASYMGTQAQALGCKRDYGGILGRADRLVILILVPLIQFLAYIDSNGKFWLFTPIEYAMIWFAVAGHITAVQRGVRTWTRKETLGKMIVGFVQLGVSQVRTQLDKYVVWLQNAYQLIVSGMREILTYVVVGKPYGADDVFPYSKEFPQRNPVPDIILDILKKDEIKAI